MCIPFAGTYTCMCTVFIYSNRLHTSLPLSKDWSRNGSTVPAHVIESVRNGEWWILRSALHIDKEVSVFVLSFMIALCKASTGPEQSVGKTKLACVVFEPMLDQLVHV